MHLKSPRVSLLRCLFLCWILFLVLSSGGKSGAAEAPNRAPENWITVRTSCEAMVPAYCQGRYGFEVWEDGVWQIGPDPSGRQAIGRLTEQERRNLWGAAGRVLRVMGSLVCSSRKAIPGVDETVVLRSSERVLKLRGAGGRLSCEPTVAAVVEFFAYVDRLMKRYYPRPYSAKYRPS